MYLPIAAEAEAASRAVAQLPAGAEHARADIAENLPAQVQPAGAVEAHEERGTPLIPSIPDATRAAARWIRPLVPPFVARAIDNTTQPLRTARQVFEEVEEIAFSLKRTLKVTVNSESNDQSPPGAAAGNIPSGSRRVESARDDRDHGTYEPREQLRTNEQYSSLDPGKDVGGLSLGPTERDNQRELTVREGPRELRSPDGPRQLPPPK